jgi:hypothetical protein
MYWRVGFHQQTHPKEFRTRLYDLNNLDREKRMDGSGSGCFGNQLRKISADMAVEESSCVLMFRDHNLDRAPSCILQVKVVAVHDLSMKEKTRVPRLSWTRTTPTRR